MKSLSDFRVDDDAGFVLRPVDCVWKNRRVLSVDQTLNHSGWALLHWSVSEQRITVGETGMVRTTSERTSHEANLEQADLIYVDFKHLLRRLRPHIVVHEYPPVSRPGLKIKRPESSLLAASALRNAAIDLGIEVYRPIPAQSVKVRFCGNPQATKADIKIAVEALDPETKAMAPMNENVRDAIANGWFAMEEARP